MSIGFNTPDFEDIIKKQTKPLGSSVQNDLYERIN